MRYNTRIAGAIRLYRAELRGPATADRLEPDPGNAGV